MQASFTQKWGWCRIRALSLILLLALCGCDGRGLNEKQTKEAGAIADKSAVDALDRSDRLFDLEVRVQELEGKAKN